MEILEVWIRIDPGSIFDCFYKFSTPTSVLFYVDSGQKVDVYVNSSSSFRLVESLSVQLWNCSDTDEVEW